MQDGNWHVAPELQRRLSTKPRLRDGDVDVTLKKGRPKVLEVLKEVTNWALSLAALGRIAGDKVHTL